MSSIKEINALNLLEWAKTTAKSDRYTYNSKHRSLTPCRRIQNVFPNLKSPVFLLGSPRSGTTFLGDCIAQLPEISYHFEPIATKAAARYLYEKHWSYLQARYFYRTVYAWLMRIYWDGDLRFAEKTPRNCFLIEFLAKAFPDSKFIHIIRDGRDAALSHSEQPWLKAGQSLSHAKEPGGYPLGAYPRFWVELERILEFQTTSDIHRCIWAWRRHVESALTSAVNLPKANYYELRYESLVLNSTQESDGLLSFLKIENPQSRKLFLKKLQSAKTTSVGRWKMFLNHEELLQIYNEAGPLLDKLGYLK